MIFLPLHARKHLPSLPLTPTPAPATKWLHFDTGVTALSTNISDQFCPSAAYSQSIDLTRDKVAVYFFDMVCSISISSTVLICNLQSSAPPKQFSAYYLDNSKVALEDVGLPLVPAGTIIQCVYMSGYLSLPCCCDTEFSVIPPNALILKSSAVPVATVMEWMAQNSFKSNHNHNM